MCVGASSDGIFASQARTSPATGPCPRHPPVVRTPDTCSHAQAQGRGSVTIAGLSYYFIENYRISDEVEKYDDDTFRGFEEDIKK